LDRTFRQADALSSLLIASAEGFRPIVDIDMKRDRASTRMARAARDRGLIEGTCTDSNIV